MPRYRAARQCQRPGDGFGHGVNYGHMFDGFRLDFVDVGEVRLRVRYGGEGPAVLLPAGQEGFSLSP
jgi:hypothetical protein